MTASLYQAVCKVSQSRGTGSCFYLKNYGLFVTNSHVVEGFREVALEDRQRNRYPAKVVFANPDLDIAFLKAEGNFSSWPQLILAREEPVIGDKIRVAGYPFGIPFTVTEGTVSSPRQFMDGHYRIQTDAAVNPGNSGGPMFNEKDEVIAITTSKFTNADNIGFGIPVNCLRPLLEQNLSLTGNRLYLQCSCCDTVCTEEEYCPSCGNKLPFYLYHERPLTDLAVYCEKAIREMGINPVLARTGHESWTFHQGISEIHMFVYRQSFLFCTSPINVLPKKNFGPLFDYMTAYSSTSPYQLGLDGNRIFLSYRVHLTDIAADTEQIVFDNIKEMPQQADRLAHYFHDTFGCCFPECSRSGD